VLIDTLVKKKLKKLINVLMIILISAVVVFVGKNSIQRENAHITTSIYWYPSSSFGSGSIWSAHMTWKGYNAAVVNFFTLINGLI
jgi:hypothetical protein